MRLTARELLLTLAVLSSTHGANISGGSKSNSTELVSTEAVMSVQKDDVIAPLFVKDRPPGSFRLESVAQRLHLFIFELLSVLNVLIRYLCNWTSAVIITGNNPSLVSTSNSPSSTGKVDSFTLCTGPSVPQKARKTLCVHFGRIDAQNAPEDEDAPDSARRDKEFLLCVAARQGDMREFQRHLSEYKTMRKIEFELSPIFKAWTDYKPSSGASNTLLLCAIHGDNPLVLQQVMAFQHVTMQDLLDGPPRTSIWDGSESETKTATHGCRPGLVEAVLKNSLQVANWLIDNGARDQPDLSGNTALKTAIVEKNHQMVDLLLGRGVSNVNLVYANNFTPLLFAVQTKLLLLVEVLLRHGASLTARNRNDETPLHIAAANGSLDIVKALTSGDHWTAEVSESVLKAQTCDNKETPLHAAVRHQDVYDYLATIDANNNLRNKHNQTAQEKLDGFKANGGLF